MIKLKHVVLKSDKGILSKFIAADRAVLGTFEFVDWIDFKYVQRHWWSWIPKLVKTEIKEYMKIIAVDDYVRYSDE